MAFSLTCFFFLYFMGSNEIIIKNLSIDSIRSNFILLEMTEEMEEGDSGYEKNGSDFDPFRRLVIIRMWKQTGIG